MEDLLDTAPCGFLAFADDGIIAAANTTLLEFLGYGPGELRGRHIESILTGGARIFYQTHFFPLLKMHGRAEEIYLSLRSGDGTDVPVLVNAARRERQGRMLNDCIIVAIRQRSRYEDELLQARKAAEEANQTKAKFLSMMSHEIRTPLQTISGYVEVLSLGIHGLLTDLQLEDLNRIESASAYLLGLINDILSFARLEAGKVDVALRVIPMDGVLERAESLVVSKIEQAGLLYTRQECEPGLQVRADPDRLQQILLNLLTNAVKFTHPGGSITVTCRRSGSQVLIDVRDTGRGIPPDQTDKIFDPFVQVDRQATASSLQGAGLGLAISRELARAMGGDITVESIHGEGSVFTVMLQMPGQTEPEINRQPLSEEPSPSGVARNISY